MDPLEAMPDCAPGNKSASDGPDCTPNKSHKTWIQPCSTTVSGSLTWPGIHPRDPAEATLVDAPITGLRPDYDP